MNIPDTYAESLSLDEKILFLLARLEGVTTQDIVSELMQLDGVAAEEALAQLHQDVDARLLALEEDGLLERINVHGRRYRLKG